jgi:hypothetical protein
MSFQGRAIENAILAYDGLALVPAQVFLEGQPQRMRFFSRIAAVRVGAACVMGSLSRAVFAQPAVPPAVAPPPLVAPPPAVAPPAPSASSPSLPSPSALTLYVPPPAPPVHAPWYAMWLGARLGVLAYGGGVYVNNAKTGDIETTGNFVDTGPALEIDAGARLGKRYIPYVGFELGLMEAGHRFDGVGAGANTIFAGGGFRYIAGDPDNIAFLGDVSFGVRRLQVASEGSSWSATAIEIFRLGLGVEIRLSSTLTVSPAITLSGGTFTNTNGNVRFGPNQGDQQTSPPFANGANIPQSDQTSYYAVVVGCGMHFDLFAQGASLQRAP